MATITENIQTLRSIKSDIKNAILQKGGSVTDAFGTYAQAITDLPSGGGGGTEIEDALVTRNLSGTYYNNRVSVVGVGAFQYCSALQSVNLPLCKYISNLAFYSCYSLISIYLPLCEYIRENAFAFCSALQSVNLPNCTSISGNYTFYSCRALQSIDLPKCTSISGEYTFQYCSALTSVNLPLVESIGNYTFHGCRALQSIDLPKCSYLNVGALSDCYNLRVIKIPLCTVLDYGCIRDCANLAQVYLNSVSSVTNMMYDNIFSNCPKLTSVYVPASLVNAFKTAKNWSSLSTKIVAYTEPTEPTKYPPLVYSAKSAGSTITVNGETVTLEQGENIELNYPNEITSVEASNNEALTYIQIPNTVTSINDNAFDGCAALSEITLPDSLTSIGVQAFQACIGLTSINIPSGVTSISMETFNACSALASVTLPEGLTNIGSSTFMDCTSLTSITIPSTVTMIDFEAFNYCEALTDFNFNGTMAQWASITKGDDWNLNAAFTVVHCTDGDVNIL